MFELFSDYFASKGNSGNSLDSRIILMVTLLAIVTVILSNDYLYPLLIFLFCILAIFLIKIPSQIIFLRLLPAMGMAFLVCALKVFLTAGTAIFTLNLWFLNLTGTAEGLENGLLIASRVLGSVSVIFLASVITPAHQIFRALGWFGVPQIWVEIAIYIYRYLFQILEIASQIKLAQKVRLGYAGAFHTLRSTGILSGSVLVRSFSQSARIAESMVARGYTGEFPNRKMGQFSSRDALFLFAFSATLITLFLGLGL